MNSTEIPDITIPLGGDAHAIAQKFAAQQSTPQQGKRVYLNTLAVYAVHRYLQWLQVETDLNQSDSWHPALVTLSDVADLVLPGIGKLECRPVLPGETTVRVPPQARENRMGCVAVQFSESLNEVHLLGFVAAVHASTLPAKIAIAHLQPLDVLFDRIPDPISQRATTPTPKIPVNLSLWLENIFETGWQTLDMLFSDLAVARSERSIPSTDLSSSETNTEETIWSVRRGKPLDLGIPVAGNPFALVVSISPTDEHLDVLLQIYPSGGTIYLPPSLQLTVLDETGVPLPNLQAEAGNRDNWIQLEFEGELGEYFRIKLTLQDVSITEYFMI